MIAKGNTHDSGPKLVAYILAAEQGERIEFGGARGFDFFGDDLLQAAAIMQQMADRTTNCRDAWFHTQTRLAPGEQLTNEQWEKVLDREEKRLGFTGHARVWSFHIDEATGEKHLHAGWFRIDPETNRAHDPGLFKLRLMEVARWAEKEFGLRELSNERQAHDKARAPERNEMEESRRLGTDVRAIRTAILDCLEHADSGKAFKSALEEQGLMLANGDRRDCFVVVDQEGGQHALNKKLTGQTLAQMRERLADLDRSQLPGVELAQEIQRERHSQVERVPEPMPVKEPANQNIGEPANENDHTPLTLEAITRDPWQAVYLNVPENADRTLLAAVAICADQCAKFAFAAARVSDVIQPELAEYCQDRQTDALARRNEARAALASLPPEQVAKVSPFLHPEQLQDRAMAGLRDALGERAAEMGLLRPVNEHLIEQNPWNALTQPLPPYASPELFDRVFTLSFGLWVEAIERQTVAYTPAEAKLWDVVRSDWELRRQEAFAAARTAEELVSRAEAWLAKGRYDDLRHAHQEAIEAAPPRQPDAKEEFRAASITEPAAPVYDREAAETAWQRELIDRAAAQAGQEAQAAAREAWKADRAAALEHARPPNRIESRIAECAELAAQATVFEDAAGRRADRAEVLADRFCPADERQISAVTVYGREAFEAKLEDAGIAIARVTEPDIKALAALREQEGFDRASGLAHKPHHFAADLVVGDLAAVARTGDVYRINPDKLGDAKSLLATDLPSVIETRARFEIEREQISELYAQRRTDSLDVQQGFAAARENQAHHAQTIRDVRQFNDEIGAVADTGFKATGRFLGGFGKVLSSFISWIADSLAPPPPPTKDQAERLVRVAEERQEQQAIIAAQQPIESQREIIAEQQRTRDIARTQGIATTGDPEEDRFRSIMQRAARDRDRDYERER